MYGAITTSCHKKDVIVAYPPEIERWDIFASHCHDMRKNSAVTAQGHRLKSLDNDNINSTIGARRHMASEEGGEDTILEHPFGHRTKNVAAAQIPSMFVRVHHRYRFKGEPTDNRRDA